MTKMKVKEENMWIARWLRRLWCHARDIPVTFTDKTGNIWKEVDTCPLCERSLDVYETAAGWQCFCTEHGNVGQWNPIMGFYSHVQKPSEKETKLLKDLEEQP